MKDSNKKLSEEEVMMALLRDAPVSASAAEGMSMPDRLLTGFGRGVVHASEMAKLLGKRITGADNTNDYASNIEDEARRWRDDLGNTTEGQVGQAAGTTVPGFAPAATTVARRLGDTFK